jgi:transcription elongation GreA/GreB family factor
MDREFKKQIVLKLEELLNAKIAEVEESVAALDESGEGETKSSAGDKYETSREMMNQERAKFDKVLQDLGAQLKMLKSLDMEKSHEVVGLGCVVEVTGMTLFVGIPYGKLTLEGKELFAISGKSPVAQLMMGKRTGDKFEMNKETLEIKDLF